MCLHSLPQMWAILIRSSAARFFFSWQIRRKTGFEPLKFQVLLFVFFADWVLLFCVLCDAKSCFCCSFANKEDTSHAAEPKASSLEKWAGFRGTFNCIISVHYTVNYSEIMSKVARIAWPNRRAMRLYCDIMRQLNAFQSGCIAFDATMFHNANIVKIHKSFRPNHKRVEEIERPRESEIDRERSSNKMKESISFHDSSVRLLCRRWS